MIFTENETKQLVALVPVLHKFISIFHGVTARHGTLAENKEMDVYQDTLNKLLQDVKDSAIKHGINI